MEPYSFKIENVVSTTKLSDHFDLNNIKPKLDGAEYNTQKFPGLIYKINEPKAVFLLFNSGKVVCTGCKSIENAKNAFDKLYRKLMEIEVDINSSYEVSVQNIVASAGLGSVLNLNTIAIGLGLENIEYEPEQFPGLVYRVDTPKVVILLFGSGKLVITGGKSSLDCRNALIQLKDTLTNLKLM